MADDVPVTERRRVAQALRDLARELTSADVDDAEFTAVAAALEPLHARLAEAPRLQPSVEGLHTAAHARERFGREPFYDRDPLVGLSNPLAPPLQRIGEPTGSEWEVTFGCAYEGHPGFVHGGYVAAVLDHVLGVAAVSTGQACMTGTLTARYRRPTPSRTRLVCVGAVDRIEGRKVFVRATLQAAGEVVVEAEGIYLLVDPDRFTG